MIFCFLLVKDCERLSQLVYVINTELCCYGCVTFIRKAARYLTENFPVHGRRLMVTLP